MLIDEHTVALVVDGEVDDDTVVTLMRQYHNFVRVAGDEMEQALRNYFSGLTIYVLVDGFDRPE